VTALLVLGIMLSIVYDTTARLFFSAPTLWVLDANEYLLVYLTFVPAGWILTRGGHVRVEILVQRLSARRQRTMDLLGSLLGVIYCAILAWQAWLVAWEAYENGYRFSTALALPRFPILVVIPIGAAWLGLGFLIKILAIVAGVAAPTGAAGGTPASHSV
jgi:TRAP-type mannitol/chloroaromatic compound transport system permease small subunit